MNEILSAHDNAIAALQAYRLRVQQTIDNADRKARPLLIKVDSWSRKGKEGEENRRRDTKRTVWRDKLDSAIEGLSTEREIVNLKINKYSGSSADFDVFLQILDRITNKTEGLTQSYCNSEAEVIERGFKEAVTKAANDDEGQSFEEYYNAL